ncbi:MAG: hybrid sensor histidine kinase/response regulator [Elusimicrobiaceae bacterium]|nr:hybrid sensor histidine kinase/response regulator [Elusimicrobiaceae bacterium]
MIKVLIVDDDANNRSLLSDILTFKHPEYGFFFASNGKEALDLLRAELPDLVLLDIVMPDIDGFEVLEQAKNDDRIKNIPVIITTAIDDTKTKVRGFRLKAADYVVKPFTPDEIIARVEVHLQTKLDQDRLKSMNESILRTQAAFIENSKMIAIGNLAAGVAHEFNNILFIMQGYVEMYADSKSPDDLARICKVFKDLVSRSKLIVEGLMGYTKRTSGMQKINPATLLKESLALMNEQFSSHNIEVKPDFEEVGEIRCNADQISQVFLNVIINAVEAMRDCPRRVLTVTLRPCGRTPQDLCRTNPHLLCQNNGKCITISFSDTGPGIAPDVRERLFNPFLTTKGIIGGGNETAPGKGLGLFISYGIIKNHSGHIMINPGEGTGATVNIVLPSR